MALPLLSLPVDWVALCSCSYCPLSGGPTCCCQNYQTWPRSDGTPGNRAAVSSPLALKAAGQCVGPGAVSAAQKAPQRILPRRDTFTPPRVIERRSDVAATITSREPLLAYHLPRPPPASA
ncbi:MAG: hypothetical protein AAF725_10945 [Acidobacteriota bacterium]